MNIERREGGEGGTEGLISGDWYYYYYYYYCSGTATRTPCDSPLSLDENGR